MKSVLVDFLVGAGIKPVSIISYNHLGNNDGKNLSAPQQFRSKEVYSAFSLVKIEYLSNRANYHRYLRATLLTIWWNRTASYTMKMNIPTMLSLSNMRPMLVGFYF